MSERANLSIGRIRLWLLRAYLHDLEEHAAGDANRFGRMVDGRGGSLGSESGWREKVAALLVDSFIVGYCAEFLGECAQRARKLGIEEPTP